VTLLVTGTEIGVFAGVFYYVLPEATAYAAEMGVTIPI